jgi:hypothetical protein
MQRLFHVLVRPVCLPWHADHAECDRVARHDPIHIASFVAILEVDGKEVLIPVEENYLTRCAICSVVQKVSAILPTRRRNVSSDTLPYAGSERALLTRSRLIPTREPLTMRCLLISWKLWRLGKWCTSRWPDQAAMGLSHSQRAVGHGIA